MFSRKLYWLLKKDDIKKHIKMCCKMYWLTKTEVSHNHYITLDYISDYLNKSEENDFTISFIKYVIDEYRKIALYNNQIEANEKYRRAEMLNVDIWSCRNNMHMEDHRTKVYYASTNKAMYIQNAYTTVLQTIKTNYSGYKKYICEMYLQLINDIVSNDELFENDTKLSFGCTNIIKAFIPESYHTEYKKILEEINKEAKKEISELFIKDQDEKEEKVGDMLTEEERAMLLNMDVVRIFNGKLLLTIEYSDKEFLYNRRFSKDNEPSEEEWIDYIQEEFVKGTGIYATDVRKWEFANLAFYNYINQLKEREENCKTLLLFNELKVIVSKEDWEFMCKYRFFTDDPDEEHIRVEFSTGTGIRPETKRTSKNLWNNASIEFAKYIKDLREIQNLDINKMARNLLTDEEKYGTEP